MIGMLVSVVTVCINLCCRYEILSNLGKGSFGQVVKGHDRVTGEYPLSSLVKLYSLIIFY